MSYLIKESGHVSGYNRYWNQSMGHWSFSPIDSPICAEIINSKERAERIKSFLVPVSGLITFEIVDADFEIISFKTESIRIGKESFPND